MEQDVLRVGDGRGDDRNSLENGDSVWSDVDCCTEQNVISIRQWKIHSNRFTFIRMLCPVGDKMWITNDITCGDIELCVPSASVDTV